MFSAWDFSSWIASLGVVLFMRGFLTGFGAIVNALMSRIVGDERNVAATTHVSSTPKEPPI